MAKPYLKGTWTTVPRSSTRGSDTALESNNARLPVVAALIRVIGSTGVTVGSAANRVRSGAWNNLSEETATVSCESADWGVAAAARSFLEAKQFYETTIPSEAVRIQG